LTSSFSMRNMFNVGDGFVSRPWLWLGEKLSAVGPSVGSHAAGLFSHPFLVILYRLLTSPYYNFKKASIVFCRRTWTQWMQGSQKSSRRRVSRTRRGWGVGSGCFSGMCRLYEHIQLGFSLFFYPVVTKELGVFIFPLKRGAKEQL
jgi:hypothetical protein